MSKPKKKKSYTGRDLNMVGIRTGANKAYVEKDQKKEANKTATRVKNFWEEKMAEDWADTVDTKIKCSQCGFPYDKTHAEGQDELAAMECGYCSVSCMDYSLE